MADSTKHELVAFDRARGALLAPERIRQVVASPSLRNKKDLIEAFVDRVSATGEVDEQWSLRADETREFVERAFRDGAIQSSGTATTRVLPPASRFSANGGHGETKERVISKLGEFFERFFGLSSNGGQE